MNSKEARVILTSDTHRAATWLQKNRVAILPFEPDGILAMFVANDPEIMARLKNRDWQDPRTKKPFVTTFPPELGRLVMTHENGIHPQVLVDIISATLDIAIKCTARSGHPLGFLFEADPGFATQHPRLVGKIGDTPTVGFMCSGGAEKHYGQVAHRFNGGLAGTSANLSLDHQRANGSGHTDIGALVAQLGTLDNLVVLLTRKIIRTPAPSTTTLLVTQDHNCRWGIMPLRDGSTPKNLIAAACSDINIPLIPAQPQKIISPYDYTGYRLFFARTFIKSVLPLVARRDVAIPPGAAYWLQSTVVPPDARPANLS